VEGNYSYVQFKKFNSSFLSLSPLAKNMIKVCVAGMGRAGKIHAENFLNRVEGAKLVGVVDPIEPIAKQASKKLGVPYWLDSKEVIKAKAFDALAICTPSNTHSRLIVEAGRAGKHVLCEKPLALSLAEAEEALKSAEREEIKLQLGYMRRFDKYYSEAKQRIEKGEIGKPLVFKSTGRDPSLPSGWTADPSLSGGIFLDMLSHDFDLARWLMGKEVKEVEARGGAWFYEEVKEKGDQDLVGVLLVFEKEGIGLVEGCRKCAYGYDLRTEVVGSEGALMVGSPYDPNFSIGKREGITPRKAQWFWERFEEAFLLEDKHFIECISKDKQPLVSGLAGKKALEIAMAAKQSLKEGKPINL
jgi:inositol 2-dehydrogenase